MSPQTQAALVRLFRDGGWAPLAVIVLNALVVASPWAHSLYWLLHLLGGAALAYFFFHAYRIFEVSGSARPLVAYALAFSLACTVGVLWEIAEFALDELTGSALQESLGETMHDLLLDVLGAAAALAALPRRGRPGP
jgi:hypothetical protein